MKEESKVYRLLQNIVENWDGISIRANQDGRWQSLWLNEIKDDKTIAKAVIDWINEKGVEVK